MKRAMTSGLALALVAGLASGCSKAGGDEQSATRPPLPEDMPECTELFTDGKTVERDSFGEACKDEDGALSVPRPMALQCVDGRVLLWNEYAWGFIDEPMTVLDEGSTNNEPVQQAMGCLQSAGVTTTAP
jgi:hypothetical protein